MLRTSDGAVFGHFGHSERVAQSSAAHASERRSVVLLANYLRIEEATHTRRRDDPEIAAKLRIEERELEAGGLT